MPRNLTTSLLVTQKWNKLGIQAPARVRQPSERLKRLFDIATAASMLLVFLPLFGLICFILLTQGRPLLIRHRRVGRGGTTFPCLKFRTMVVDAEAVLQRHLASDPAAREEWEASHKLKNDPRVTALGRVLRKTSIDELPQLFNVLRGEMSLVGPRPIVPAEVIHYGIHIERYHEVRPGLTGAWQISGRSDVSYEQRVALDCAYVAGRSFRRDLGILVRTVPAGPAAAAASLWGDGFAGDRLSDLRAVTDWHGCVPDEYILLFPRLAAPGGQMPAVLRAHLEAGVAVRAWRLARLDRRGGVPALRARLPGADEGARRHGDWFADADAVTCLLRKLGLLRTAPDRVAAERATLCGLDALLADIQEGRVPDWSDAAGTLLAFGAGIHPAYLWPEAALAPARGVAAGWLGHLDRGRTALMPLVVAEYMLDALRDGAVDRPLLDLAGGSVNLAILRQAAARRVAGHDPAVRLRHDTAAFPGRVAGRARRSLALGAEA